MKPEHSKSKPEQTFQNGVGLENLLFDPRVLARHGRQELQDQLRRLCLSGPRFTGDDDSLVTLVTAHEVVCVVRDGEDVRGQVADLRVLVHFDVLAVVAVQQLVGVDGDKNRARVCLYVCTGSLNEKCQELYENDYYYYSLLFSFFYAF